MDESYIVRAVDNGQDMLQACASCSAQAWTLARGGQSSVGSDKYIRAALKMQKGDYTAAASLLGNCTYNGSVDGYCRVLSILNSAKQTGNCPRFSAGQITELESIASDEENPGHAQARAILYQEFETEFPINIWNDLPEWRSLEVKAEVPEVKLVQAQPNPADNTVWITYKSEEGAQRIALKIFDPQGRVVLDQDVTSSKGIFEWDSSKMSDGLYVIELFFDDVKIDTDKVTLAH